jgi:thymidine kinase
VREHQNVSVVVIKTGFEHELIIKYNQYDLYIFDEGQFFDQKIAQYLSELVFMGKRIYFTALLHDFKDEVFPTTQAVMTLPEVSNIKKLYNQCSICGKDGLHSARMYQGKIVSAGPQVLIGDMGSSEKEYTYIGICTYCKKQALGKI